MRVKITLLSAVLFCGCGGGKTEPAQASEAPTQNDFEEARVQRQQLLEEAQARQEAEKEKLRAQLEGVGSVKLVKMRVKKAAASKGFDMTVRFKNEGDKELVQAEGRLEFYGPGDKLLKMAKMPIRQSIPAGEAVTKSGKFPFDAESKGDAALAELNPKQVELKWVPSVYRFADGSALQGVD